MRSPASPALSPSQPCDTAQVSTTAEFQLDLDGIRDAVTPRTRAIVTISPNNPTGAVYPERDLRAVNALCQEQGLYHISDEAYEYFVYDGGRHFSPSAIAGGEGHTISLFSLRSVVLLLWPVTSALSVSER